MNSKYGVVKVFAETIEDEAVGQIAQLANSPVGENAHIRIMPDAHAGKGCVIGTTMQITDKVCPNLVGVDIGCGVMAIQVTNEQGRNLTAEDYEKLNQYCQNHVVAGRNVRTDDEYVAPAFIIRYMRCFSALNEIGWIDHSMGTLGGGNHFIELDRSVTDGSHWLVIHTGSRNLGKQVAEYYQNIAQKSLTTEYQQKRAEVIAKAKAEGRQHEISTLLQSIQKTPATGLEFLTGEDLENYLHDMKICQMWAHFNRTYIIQDIIVGLGWTPSKVISSIHNYIDVDNRILRKGSISAQEGEDCLIPLNMRDGTLICKGKGNPDWNYSAPHGAGRVLSRAAAKRQIRMEDYIMSMRGVVSSSVCEATLDESPFAYKDADEIARAITDTVEIVDRIVPVFNYKAAE